MKKSVREMIERASRSDAIVNLTRSRTGTQKSPKPKRQAASALSRKKRKIAVLLGKDPNAPKPVKSIYSEIIAELICGQLAEGKTLKGICLQEGYPSPGTIMGC